MISCVKAECWGLEFFLQILVNLAGLMTIDNSAVGQNRFMH